MGRIAKLCVCCLFIASCTLPAVISSESLCVVQYKEQIASLKSKAVEDMESVKRKDHLEFVEVDPSTLKAGAI